MTVAPIVTVDGPSGAGKGTVTSLLAAQRGWHLLDSGALYRLTALSALKRRMVIDDEKAIATIAELLDVRFQATSGAAVTVWLDDEEVTQAIRQEKVGLAASTVASQPAVRAALLQRQRDFAMLPGLVADGRDMGTTVFPTATLKIYLTASAEERTRRRLDQLQKAGISVSFGDLLQDIQARDERDQTRSASPLKPAVDAIMLDTTELDIPDVVTRIDALLDERLKV